MDDTRRSWMKRTFSAIAGLTVGHSVLAQKTAATFGRPSVVTIKVPEQLKYAVLKPNLHELTAESKLQVARSIAPALSSVMTAAGFKLSPAAVERLTAQLAARGTVNIPVGGTAAEYSLSVEASSLNYNSSGFRGNAIE